MVDYYGKHGHIINSFNFAVNVPIFFSICNGDGRLLRFSSMISYGYFGDLMSRSESYRWLGPRRYDISGVRTFLGNIFFLKEKNIQ